MIKLVSALVISTGMLIGCGAGEPSPRETVYVVEPPSPGLSRGPTGGGNPSQQDTDEQEFIADIQRNGMTDRLGPVPQSEVLKLGYLVCDAFEQGAAAGEVIRIMINSGITRTDATLIAASASVNLCPEFNPSDGKA